MALALALNKTMEGIDFTCSYLIGTTSLIFGFTELSTNPVVNRRAQEQAGIQIGDSFEITDFNYNVSAVTKLLKMHFDDTYFDGESV